MYNPKSLKAEEFINHEEIMDTLSYAEANKNNAALIDSLIEKARLRKGLTHREASVLLACDMEDKILEIYDLAEQIKKDFYGNRIVMFAPLYLSNYCVNGCVYCPYHHQNGHIPRKKLTQEDIVREVTALQDMGHKRLAIEAGEDPVNNPIEYILECIKTIYSIKHKNGAIRRVNVNIAATTCLLYTSNTRNSFEPKPTSPVPRTLTFAVFPFSRQGVILAIMVSPLRNFVPPVNGASSYSGISRQNGWSLSIAIFFATVPFFIVSLGLNSAISASLHFIPCLLYTSIG